MLIVAERFQTGFDQPLLHTMYVDKVLVGLAAVQTLSRLNRIHPLKESTFVLDFRNDADTIVEAFEQFRGSTFAPPTDANIRGDTRTRLDEFDVLRPEEVEAAMLGAGGPDETRSAAAYAALGPAKARYEALDDEQQLEFRDVLHRFVRTYSFVSQIVVFTDLSLERDYIYCRALSFYLRDTDTVQRLDLGTEVELTHLRHQVTYSGSLALESDIGHRTGPIVLRRRQTPSARARTRAARARHGSFHAGDHRFEAGWGYLSAVLAVRLFRWC